MGISLGGSAGRCSTTGSVNNLHFKSMVDLDYNTKSLIKEAFANNLRNAEEVTKRKIFTREQDLLFLV